jgi:F-type H+-transporting ATPase subunit epsilon
MATPFRCRLVTPTESMLDQQASYVSIPAWDGQKGVMPGTSPFLSQLGVGSMRVDFPSGASRWYLVDGGFAQMSLDALTILANRAWPAENLDESSAEKALADARDAKATGPEREALDRAQELARATLTMAKAASTRGI